MCGRLVARLLRSFSLRCGDLSGLFGFRLGGSGGVGLVVGAVALAVGEEPGGQGDDEDDGDGGEEASESSVLAGLVGGALAGFGALVLVEVVAGLEEVVFGGCERGVSGGVLGGDEAAAAEQHRLVAAVRLPVVRGGVQGAAQADDVAVLVDPFDESWPFAQQGFVGDFDDGFAGDGVDVGDEQPVGEEPVDDGGVDTGEFVAGGAAAQVVVVVAGRDELGEQQADVVAVAGGGVGRRAARRGGRWRRRCRRVRGRRRW